MDILIVSWQRTLSAAYIYFSSLYSVFPNLNIPRSLDGFHQLDWTSQFDPANTVSPWLHPLSHHYPTSVEAYWTKTIKNAAYAKKSTVRSLPPEESSNAQSNYPVTTSWAQNASHSG